MTKGKKWGIAIAVVIAVIALPVSAYLAWSDETPAVTIPTIPMPHPNGYDIDMQAGKALVNEKAINPAFYAAYQDHEGTLTPAALASDTALIQQNSAALNLLNSALAYPCAMPVSDSEAGDISFETNFVDIKALMQMDVYVQRANGQWPQAASTSLDLAQFGANLQPAGSMDLWEIASISQLEGLRSLWPEIPHLDKPSCLTDIARLTKMDQVGITLPGALQREEWIEERQLLATFQHSDWRKAMIDDTFTECGVTDDANAATARGTFALMLAKTSKSRIMQQRQQFFTYQIRSAKAPYAAPVPIPMFVIDPQEFFLEDFNQLPEIGQPRTHGALRQALVSEETREIMLTLALRIYELDHHQLPNSLTQLVPAYLPSLPSDPFALKGTFHYSRTGSTYALYSVGPDGHDDHGTPIKGPVKDDSKGDLVGDVQS